MAMSQALHDALYSLRKPKNSQYDLQPEEQPDKMEVSQNHIEAVPAQWKKYQQSLLLHLLVDKLREATRKQDGALLEKLLQEAEQEKVQAPQEIQMAQRTLAVIQNRDALTAAMASNDKNVLQQAIDDARKQDKQVIRKLKQELKEASNKLANLRQNNRSRNILPHPRRSLEEIRSFIKPPAALKCLVEAFLLLLGETQEKTKSWEYCIKQLNEHGMYQRFLNYDVATLHPEIAAQAKEIIKDLNVDMITKNSFNSVTLYVWCLGNIDVVEQAHLDDGTFIPASIARQKEILDPPAPSPSPPKLTRAHSRCRINGYVGLSDDVRELSSFVAPPAEVKCTVPAMLLLLGDDESKTSDWGFCTRVLRSLQKDGVVARMQALDAAAVHPGIAARAKEMLSHFSVEQTTSKSKAAGSSFKWCEDIISVVEQSAEDGTFVPATLSKQQEIFAPNLPPPSPRKIRRSPFKKSVSTESDDATSVRKSLVELKSLCNPPVGVIQAIQALLLLHGHDEIKTNTWRYCKQQLAQPVVLASLSSDNVHPEIASRAREMIEDLQEHIKEKSAAAYCITTWCLDVISQVEATHQEKGSAVPASARRQRQILTPRSPSPRKRRPPSVTRSNSNGSLAGNDGEKQNGEPVQNGGLQQNGDLQQNGEPLQNGGHEQNGEL